MSNNKQSSVDFLFQNMFELSQTLVTSGETQYELMMQVYQQAKAMHEKEIKDAYEQGDADAYWEFHDEEPRTFVDKHDYYNETYK